MYFYQDVALLLPPDLEVLLQLDLEALDHVLIVLDLRLEALESLEALSIAKSKKL